MSIIFKNIEKNIFRGFRIWVFIGYFMIQFFFLVYLSIQYEFSKSNIDLLVHSLTFFLVSLAFSFLINKTIYTYFPLNLDKAIDEQLEPYLDSNKILVVNQLLSECLKSSGYIGNYVAIILSVLIALIGMLVGIDGYYFNFDMQEINLIGDLSQSGLLIDAEEIIDDLINVAFSGYIFICIILYTFFNVVIYFKYVSKKAYVYRALLNKKYELYKE